MDQADPLGVALAGDGVLPGLFVMEFASRGIGRIAAATGAEFVVYDTEHTGWSMETVAPLLATTPVRRWCGCPRWRAGSAGRCWTPARAG